MSPRQWQQLVLLTILVGASIAEIALGDHVVLASFCLLAFLVAATSLLRYYRRGAKPLDRGGQPFWHRWRG
jgi:hypothetical protein